MSYIIHRDLHRLPLVVAGASGVTLRDSSGKTYIDAGGAGGVSSLGYDHPHVIAALHRQIDQCACAHGAFFGIEAAEELAARLLAQAPGGFGAVSLVSGGSAAMETAIRLARRHAAAGGEGQRRVFIARRQSCHGATLGALALGDEPGRTPFAPLLMDVPRVAPCYEYRGRTGRQSLDAYTAGLLDELETAILKAGPRQVLAFVAEPVAGALGGAIPPTPGYFAGVRAICDRHGILFIADEVMCGMGRTGTMFAIEQDGVTPDIIAVGNGLGAGYQAVGAVLVRDAIARRLREDSGGFPDGQDCAGHPVAAAAALAVLEVIERDGLLLQVRRRGATFRRMLDDVFGQHEHVGDIRGRGLFVGIELVRERATREPFAPQRRLHAAIRDEAMARGLMVYARGGTADGERGDHLLLAPPFTASASDLSEIVARLAEAVDAALAA